MNLFGFFVGLLTLLILGLGFLWVIRGERYLGYLWWPYCLGLGGLLLIGSLFIHNAWGSALVGILGGSVMWGATELKEQAIRAELGWFPFNPKKIKPPFAEVIARWPAPHL